MPNRLRKRCGFRGCPNTTTERYCAEHLRLIRRESDRRRGSTTERGYDGDWERLAQQRRELDGYLCQACLLEERITASKLVDHIYPIHVRPDWRLEIANTQVLCRPCHTRKTSADNQRYGGPSSTPTTQQQANRLAAQHITTPPRCDIVLVD
jgi:5-methylcytosine-specific restriction protein A